MITPTIQYKSFILIILSLILLTGPVAAKIFIDVGHGGNDPGTVGPHYNLREADINLAVALHLRDTLISHGFFEEYDFKLLRKTDAFYDLIDRALLANDYGADEFLSIHHNADSTGYAQGTEVWYCTQTLTPDNPNFPYSNRPRQPYDTLAKKIYYQILEEWEYHPREVRTANFLVLAYTTMIGVISEASFLTDASEEALFADPYQVHVKQEAHALYTGWRSYVDRQGFGRIEYRYMGEQPQDSPFVMVDYETHKTPYERTWPLWSQHVLNTENFWVGQQYYQFYCWKDVEYSTGRVWYEYSQPQISVAAQHTDDNYHYYEAFFKGGPFNFDIVEPSQAVTYLSPGTSQQIKWGAPPGVFDACSLKVAFSSNGGGSWQDITPTPVHYHYNSPPLANQGYINWTVPSVSAGSCRLRLIYWDFVGNRDTTISHSFAIGCALTQARFVWETSPYYWPVKITFRDQSTNFPTGWYWEFGDGTTSTLANPTHRYYAGDYTVRLRATNTCGSDDTLWVNCIHVDPCLATTPDDDNDNRGNGCDNCWAVYNPNQEDGNRDGLGDSCCCRYTTGNLTYDMQEQVDLADLSLLIAFMTQTPRPILPCPVEANVNGVEYIDLSDISFLVAYLTVTPRPTLPNCPHPYVSPPWEEFTDIRETQ